MKAIDSIIYLLCIGGALAGYFFLDPPLSWIAITCCALFAVWTFFAADTGTTPILQFAGVSWSMENSCAVGL